MHLALVTATPANVSLGSGTFVAARNLSLGLEKLGHRVRVVQPSRPLPVAGYALARLAFNASLSPKLVRDCDLVCGFDMDGGLLARRTNLPFVCYLHGIIADEARFERGWSRWSLKAMALAERAAARGARLVLVPSAYSARMAGELYGIDPSRVRVVPPAFDLDLWERALARAHPAAADTMTVLCVGRMYPRKNHAALLRAAALLAPSFPGLRVHIVGDGPEKPRLQRLAVRLGLERTVSFFGQSPFEALVEEYASCDVFCLPSLQEGFGIVFAESMTAGKPVVACDAGAAPETIRNGENGFLVPPGNDGALSQAIAKLLGDPSLRRTMGEANRAAARARFGLEAAAQHFVKAVEPLV